MQRAAHASSPADFSLPPVSAIILAAGASRRFGAAKLLVPLPAMAGRTALESVVDRALQAGFAQTIVVAGCYFDEMAARLADRPIQLIFNRDWEQGLSTSVRAGLAALPPDTQAVVLMLADQPAVSPALLRQLVDTYRQSGAPIVAPVYRGRRGNPVLFDRRTFDRLRQVTGDQGGRQVIASGEFDVEHVIVEDRAVLLDIDRQEDVSALSNYLKEQGEE